MKSRVVLALLCAMSLTSMSRAALVYEFSGLITISQYYPPTYNYPSGPASSFTAWGALNGKCSPPYCTDTIDSAGVRWTGGYPGQSLIDVRFTFDNPGGITPVDGVYAGTTSGYYLEGNGIGTYYARYDLNFTQVRIFNDNLDEDVNDAFVVSVPEPGSWAYLIVGFALAGSLMRRSNAGRKSRRSVGRAFAAGSMLW